MNSIPPSRSAVCSRPVRDFGYGAYFPAQAGAIEDDHMPTIKLGANAIDLIHFDYGHGHTCWHTEKDTIDKLSPRSLQMSAKYCSKCPAVCGNNPELASIQDAPQEV